MKTNLTLDDFNYNLPEELIAKYPTEKRDEAKMLVVDKITGDMVHKHFYDFIDYLNPDDVLILNNTKVIPARLLGKKRNRRKY